eukprot:134930_1
MEGTRGRDVRVDNDVSNLFKSELLSIFKNVKIIIIKTTNNSASVCYTLSVICLLSLIESTSLDKIIIKAVTKKIDGYNCIDTKKIDGYNWIESLWNVNKEIITNKYHIKKYNINKESYKTKG